MDKSKIVNRFRNISKIFIKDSFIKDEMNVSMNEYEGQASSDLIKNKLESESPCLISRFGSVELSAVINYLYIKKNKAHPFREAVNYILLKSPFYTSFDKEIIQAMFTNAGFFPPEKALLEQFGELMIQTTSNIDILGSWREYEKELEVELTGAIKVRLADLEPHRHSTPWTSALYGKKVLVIHPFKDSIEKQYAIREKIFPSYPDLLPEFNLITYKSVQSIAGNASQFKNWFEALEAMKNDIAKIDFDIALIGCGAYGMPLGAYIKRMGKKAVHLGGHTQFMFGIKGNRWENHKSFNYLINENWIKPQLHETPSDVHKVENACYW